MAEFSVVVSPGTLASNDSFSVTVTATANFKGTVDLTAQTDNGTTVQLNSASMLLCPEESESTTGSVGSVAAAGTLTITGTGEGQSDQGQAILTP